MAFRSVKILCNPAFWSVVLFCCAGVDPATAGKPEILFESVQKIYSDGKWNGRPAIEFWRGQYYIFFRSGLKHGEDNGAIFAMRSKYDSPRDWSTVPIIDGPDNEAEVHVLATPGRLFAYLVMEDPVSGEVIGSKVIHTDDGVHWSKPVPVYSTGFSVWKPRSHKGVHYVAADVLGDDPRVELLKSSDGLKWEKVSNILQEGKSMTETDLVFLKDGTLLALTRQGRLSRSQPPYTEWTNHNCSFLGGPALGRVGDTVLASGRCTTSAKSGFPDDQPGGGIRTGLFVVDTETMKLHWKMNLPSQSGGDSAYPHFYTLDNRRMLFAWYDGQVWKKGLPRWADIMLAVLRVE
ncbi:MAG: hypothetical protein CMJ81_16285 [Planctomycetaceae bacterium]|nr:hypothetical protein [Planctomycetaceae bacterium]